MTVLFQTVISMILHLKRTCPKCKREQVVPMDMRKKTVKCKYCGGTIPPRK